MAEQNQPQDYNRYILRGAAVIVAIGVLALAAPVLIAAAKGGAGLLAIGGIGAVLYAGVQALPLLGQKWENKLLQLRKAEAATNPIEQMQGKFQADAQKLNIFRQAITSMKAQIDGMRDMLAKRKRDKPNTDYSVQEGSLAKMYAYYDGCKTKYEAAVIALKDYEDMIQDEIFKWEFANAAQGALATMNPLDQKNILNEILSIVAVKSVQDNFNSVLAQIDMEVSTLNSKSKLTFDGGLSIDTSHIQIPQIVPLKR